jgi:hypothetical protein
MPRDNEWLLGAAFLAEVARALGDTTRAATLFDLLVPLAECATFNPPEGALGAVARTVGVLAATVGRRDDALAHLRRAIEIDTAVGATPWVAHAQVELAEVLLSLEERQEALAQLVSARTTATALGMTSLIDRVGALESL